MERLIGKLVRVSLILPGSSCFLKSLRPALHSAVKGRVILEEICIFDLKLWLIIINWAMKGAPISHLILRMPTMIKFTDTSGKGMGSYDLLLGIVWNYKFPIDILNHTTINYLEFFTVIVDLLLAEMMNSLDRHHLLSWIDNSTSVSWGRKQPRLDKFAFWMHRIL